MGRAGGWCLLAALACIGCGGSPSARGERPERRTEGAGAEALQPAPSPAPLAPVASVASTDAWLDLIAQRPSAVTSMGSRLVVRLDRADARRHLSPVELERWQLGAVDEGRGCARLMGRGASLYLPLDGPRSPAAAPDQDLAIAITLRSALPGQVMTVLWNEEAVVNLRVDETWRRRTITIPSRLLAAGENRLRVHFRTEDDTTPTAWIEQVELGSVASIKETPSTASIVDATMNREGAATLSLAPGGALGYYLVPPRRGRLVIAAAGEGSMEVVASTDRDHQEGRLPRVLSQRALKKTGEVTEVDLSGYGGVPTRLEVRVRNTRAGKSAGVNIDMLQVQTRRSVPVDRRRRVPRDVYVIAVEGFRADELSPARIASGAYPSLAQLRREALSFSIAYAPGAAAVPAHAAMQSSVAPLAHLTGKGTFVAQSWTVMAEVLERAGFDTRLISANSYVSAERGLTQGMGQVSSLRAGPVGANTATHVVARVFELLKGSPRKSLSYMVMNDPQAPYDPPQAFVRAGDPPPGAPPQHLTHMWVGRAQLGREMSATEVEYVRSLYRGELRVVDMAVGNLLDGLEAQGRLEEAIIVLVGMHGEEFLEHGSAGHGRTLYEESLRVPLMIWAPQLLAPGEVTVPVDLLDVAPTLLDLLGVEPPTDWQGRSLVPVIDDPQPPPQVAVATLGDGSSVLRAQTFKLIVGGAAGPAGAQFYDLDLDPLERDPVDAGGGIGVRIMRTAAVWEHWEQGRWKRQRWGNPLNLAAPFALDHGM